MDNSENDWVKNPTKKQLIYVIILWFVSVEFVVISITDRFTKSFFGEGNILMYMLILISTLITLYVVRNYFKNKKENT